MHERNVEYVKMSDLSQLIFPEKFLPGFSYSMQASEILRLG